MRVENVENSHYLLKNSHMPKIFQSNSVRNLLKALSSFLVLSFSPSTVIWHRVMGCCHVNRWTIFLLLTSWLRAGAFHHDCESSVFFSFLNPSRRETILRGCRHLRSDCTTVGHYFLKRQFTHYGKSSDYLLTVMRLKSYFVLHGEKIKQTSL